MKLILLFIAFLLPVSAMGNVCPATLAVPTGCASCEGVLSVATGGTCPAGTRPAFIRAHTGSANGCLAGEIPLRPPSDGTCRCNCSFASGTGNLTFAGAPAWLSVLYGLQGVSINSTGAQRLGGPAGQRSTWSMSVPTSHGIGAQSISGETVCSTTTGTVNQPIAAGSVPADALGGQCWCRLTSPAIGRWVFLATFSANTACTAAHNSAISAVASMSCSQRCAHYIGSTDGAAARQTFRRNVIRVWE